MRASASSHRATCKWICLFAVFFGSAIFGSVAAADDRPGAQAPAAEQRALGRELFLREWLPNDPRAHGGDGLGPVFNDSSCVACHNQGGPGGGGPTSKNVDLISAFLKEDDSAKARKAAAAAQRRLSWNVVRASLGMPIIPDRRRRKASRKLDIERLAQFHPGLRTSRTVVLHHSGTELEFRKWHPLSGLDGLFESASRARSSKKSEPPYEVWRLGERATAIWMIVNDVAESAQRLIGFVESQFGGGLLETGGEFGLVREAVLTRGLGAMAPRGLLLRAFTTEGLGGPEFGEATSLAASQRNPTALFGAGLIDAIPDAVIEQAAATRHRGFAGVRGRVHRLRDGKIGRFGWKAQIASLRDFTLTACAVELGVNVPGHEQAIVPYKPDYRPPGLDMNEAECDALVAFLAGLPAPKRAASAGTEHAALMEAGEKFFAETGCAACHLPKLGDVEGIYSDLLLHKMGPALSDGAIYGQQLPESDEGDLPPAAGAVTSVDQAGADSAAGADDGAVKRSRRAPRRSEWRTAPLWGLRDSSPYLHDGRAETIEEAIAMHGGEALASTNRFFKLPHDKRQQLVGFLKSLAAPDVAAIPVAASNNSSE
jgi:CxxC motif-containing protein (DUF1111 family)